MVLFDERRPSNGKEGLSVVWVVCVVPVLPLGGWHDTTGNLVESPLSGVWDIGALASPGCTLSAEAFSATLVPLAEVFSKVDKLGAGDPVRLWHVNCELHRISESGEGLSGRDALCFPLVLPREGDRRQRRAAGQSSSSLSRRAIPSWTRDSSTRLRAPIDLLGAHSCKRACDGVSGRTLRSRIKCVCGEWECDAGRLGDCECDCDGPGSQRYVRSCDGGGGIPGGISYFRRNDNHSHVHEAAPRGVPARESRICRDLYMANEDNNIFLQDR
jgi:hypothetical protein